VALFLPAAAPRKMILLTSCAVIALILSIVNAVDITQIKIPVS
jgi:hypothetical protein